MTTTGWRRALTVTLVAATTLGPVMAIAADKSSTSKPSSTSKSPSTSSAYKSTDDDFEWSGRIAAGKSIEIKGVNGAIFVNSTSGTEVKVVAKKDGRKSDPAEVSIEVIEHAGGVTVCAVYPTPWGDRPNECAPGEGGRMNTKNNDVEVEFTVQVPAGVGFIGRTVNGDIRGSGLKADAEAVTVNGSIELSTRGTARATTVNGSIDAEMGALTSGALEFETVNGGITVTIPAGSGADVSASTVNGDITTDFPITVKGKFNKQRLTGTIGKGGADLRLTTLNGSIRLRSAS
jgi:hypothetical protein